MAGITTNNLLSDSPEGEIEEIEDTVDHQFRRFKNFEVVATPPSDHHFLSHKFDASFICIRNFRNPLTRSGRARKERIEKEWELLKTRLPNSIFVRAYSARPELMRAAVIGLHHPNNNNNSNNNPYGYGLFFFDIMLPAQYPAKPPLIHHRSNGLALEPSRFIRTGSTWAIPCFTEEGEDEEEERWDPEKWSVVHALGFIQRHVVEGRRQIKGERCNEVLVLSHRAMAKTLRDPPGGFEDFVRGYFRKFSHRILMQLKGYLEEESGVGPMGMLTFVQLVNEFEANGSYCRHLLPDSGMN